MAQNANPAQDLAAGDEGMWTLDNLPLKQLQERYGFEPDARRGSTTCAWPRCASTTAAPARSSRPTAWSSPTTTWPWASSRRCRPPEKDYVSDGFFARTPRRGDQCPDLELNVLVVDGERDRAGAGRHRRQGLETPCRTRQRKAEIARIEKESIDKTRLRSDVVELYQGGEYWLYRYKKYTDMRLVMAPEVQAAFYGGDSDNFAFPRYDLDMAFFRVYEDGKPAQIPALLQVEHGGRQGRRARLRVRPPRLDRPARHVAAARVRARQSTAVPARAAHGQRVARAERVRGEGARAGAPGGEGPIFGFENSFKAVSAASSRACRTRSSWRKKAQTRRICAAKVAAEPDLSNTAGGSWDRIAAAERQAAGRATSASLAAALWRTRSFRGLRQDDRALRRRGRRSPTRSATRSSAIPRWNRCDFRLFSPAPIYPDLEEHMLADGSGDARTARPDDPYVKAASSGNDAATARPRELIAGTKLGRPAVRKALVEGGPRPWRPRPIR